MERSLETKEEVEEFNKRGWCLGSEGSKGEGESEGKTFTKGFGFKEVETCGERVGEDRDLLREGLVDGEGEEKEEDSSKWKEFEV